MAIGNPVSTTSSSVASKTSSVIATAGQTLFTVPAGYVTNHISVFRNGIRLVDGRDYEARNGATVTLLAAATVGDVLEFHVFDTFSVADAVTNQGGTIFGDLTVEGSIGDITANNVTGVAATFTGAVSVGGVLTYEDVTNIDSVGIITARSDLSIADKIIHTGDTNTSIRFPAADTITAETGGSERLRITSGGNVGIGTDNPSSIFDVETGTGSGINFGSDGANAPSLHFMAGSVRLESAAQILVCENSGGGDFIIKTKNSSGSLTTRVSVNKDGNFSLGNTTINLPSGTGLQVYDASTPRLKLANSTTGVDSGSGSLLYVSGSDFLIENKESANMRFYTAATERLRIDSSGRVLIGTTSPGTTAGEQLTIAGSSNAGMTIRSSTTAAGSILFEDTASDRGEIQYSHNGDYMRFKTAGSERIRIDSSGRVGIGETSPGSYDSGARNLVVGSTGSTGILIKAGTTSYSNLYFGDGTGSASYRGIIAYNHSEDSLRFGAAGQEAMRINSLGDVGIGVSPSGVKLHLKGNYMRIDDVNQNLGTIFIGAENGVNTIYSQTANAAGGNHPLRFMLGGSAEAMRIDSTGYMGLGTISPQHILHLHRPDSGTNYIQITNSTTGAGAADGCLVGVNASEDVILWQREANNIQFGTSNTEQMRIDSSGRLLLNTQSVISSGQLSVLFNGTAANGITLKTTRPQNNSTFIVFYRSDGTTIGYITQNATNSTFYATSSDYRLKENVVPIPDGISRVKQLKPCRFNFIDDTTQTVDGFLAHETQTVVPESVNGTKDQVDDEGKAVMQGIDQSKLVPLLTAALQEAITEIESLKARVTTLEG